MDTSSKIEDYVVQTLEIAADIVGRAMKLFGVGDDRGRPQDALRKRCTAAKQGYLAYQRRRRDLITPIGAGPPMPADTLRLLLQEVDQQLAHLRQQFTGVHSVDSGTVRCEYTPPARYRADLAQAPGFRPVQERTLYRFSPAVGLTNPTPSCIVSEELAPDPGVYVTAWRRVLAARLSAQVPADLSRRWDEDLGRVGATEGLVARLASQRARELTERLRTPIAAGNSVAVLAGLGAALEALRTVGLPEALQTAPKDRCDAEALRVILDGLDRRVLQLDLARAVEGALIPQFGVVAALAGPGDVKSLAAHYSLDLYPTLGALQHFAGKSSALKMEGAAATGRLDTAVLDATAEKRQVDQARELDDLVRERKLLEERKRIRELQADLATPQAEGPGKGEGPKVETSIGN